MDRKEQIKRLEELASELKDSSPAVALVLYGLIGAMHTNHETIFALYCKYLIQELLQEARLNMSYRKHRLN